VVTRLADGLVDATPKCTTCNRPSAGIRNVPRKQGKRRNAPRTAYWESACMDHLSSQAYTDPETVRVHTRNGYVPWADWQARQRREARRNDGV
jgi:hypothetical protein